MPGKSKPKRSNSNKKKAAGGSKPANKSSGSKAANVANDLESCGGKVEIGNSQVETGQEDQGSALIPTGNPEKGSNPLYARGRTELTVAPKGDGTLPTEETVGSELPPEKIPPTSDDAMVTSDGINKEGGQGGNAIVGDGNKLDEKTTADSSTPLQRTSSDHNNNTPDALKKEILEVKETPPAPQEPKADPPAKATSSLNPRLDQTVDLLNYPKHPLQDEWTFWYFDAGKYKEWEKNLTKLADFSYVEDFWGIVNHLRLTNESKTGSDFLVFKKGVQPMWEDPANRDGGRWMIKLALDERLNDKSHQAWIDLLLMVIGNNVDCRQVTGVVFNVRGQCDKMSMWLSTASRSDEKYILEVGNAFKNILYGKFHLPLKFENHKDTQGKTGRDAKSMYALPMGGGGGGGQYRGSHSYSNHYGKY